MKQILKCLAGLLLFIGGSNLSAYAQDDFNPDSPQEPQANFKVRTSVEPQSAGAWVSVWDDNYDGRYTLGERIYLDCPSVNGAYVFTHWTLNGEEYSKEPYISYTIEQGPVNFVAHYTFSFAPENPDDPASVAGNRLYLTAEPLTACSFNQESGRKWEYDEWIYLYASPTSSGFVFLGWYNDKGTLVSAEEGFYFQMPNSNVRLTAKYEYNPVNPSEPESDGTQDDVQNHLTGDANGDGVVDVADAVRVIKLSLAGEYEARADANIDGVVDVTDAVSIINICLNKR